MSGIQGKKGRNIDKLLVAESGVPSIGFKNIRALHEAAAGDTIIDISALTDPAKAVANGYVQPAASDLQKVSLRAWKDNVTIETGAGKMIQDIDYVITGAKTIRLEVPAADAQIFEIKINAEGRSGTTLTDAQPLVATGTLAAGTTDFNTGEPFQVGKFPTKQIGSVAVYVDNQIAYRNEGNQPDGVGDYYEVHAGAGLGTLIRFNSTDTEDRDIVVLSVGSLVERPDGSMMAYIDTLAGQQDVLREILEEVTETTIAPGAPNNVDLKAFNDRVLQNEQDIETKQDKFEIEHQTKFLSADHSGVGVMSDLTFNNLEVGKTYRIGGKIQTRGTSDVLQVVEYDNGATRVGRSLWNPPATTSPHEYTDQLNVLFVATATTLTFTYNNASATITGNGTVDETHITLEELPNHKTTTKWT